MADNDLDSSVFDGGAETPSAPSVEGLPKLGKRELEALREVRHYNDRRGRYYWREASMKKLHAHGFVDKIAGNGMYPMHWQINNAGRARLAAGAPTP